MSEDERILEQLGKPREYWENEEGYAMLHVTEDGRVTGLRGFMFTVAIIADIEPWGYGDRWCYEDGPSAVQAYLDWLAKDCRGEPEGWHRHPATGRRVHKKEGFCEVRM